MAHTPGPWTVEGWKGIVVNDSRGTTIAVHPGDSRQYGIEEVQANARLIAAAPDMLEALQGLYEHCAMVHHTWGDGCNQKEADAAIALGRAAIARATTDGQ